MLDDAHLGRSIAKNAAILSSFNALGVLAALAVDALVAALFGLGAITDAFFIAYTVPQFLRLVLAGSFQASLIPAFAAALAADDDSAMWRLFRLVGTVWTAGLAVGSLIGVLAAGPLVRILGSGLLATDQILAASLAKVLFLTLPALGLGEIIRAALIAHDRYLAASVAMLVNFGATLTALALGARGSGIHALAWGYVIGSLAQLLWLMASLIWIGGSLRPAWDPRDPDLREALRLVGQRMSGVALRRSSMLFERFVASYLPAGSITALTYSQRVSLSLWQVFANSVSTAVLPNLTASAQQGLIPQVRKGMAVGFRLLSFVVWPAATGLAVLSVPIVRLLFQRGAFDPAATAQTAALLRIYAFSIPALALVQMFLAPHYAQKDARTPTVHMIVILLVSLVLTGTLTWIFGAIGLATAYTLSAFASLARSYWITERRLGDFGDLGMLRFLGQVGLACLAMAALVLGGNQVVGRVLGESSGMLLAVQIVGLSGLGVLVYAGVTHLLGIRELSRLVSAARSRTFSNTHPPAPIS